MREDLESGTTLPGELPPSLASDEELPIYHSSTALSDDQPPPYTTRRSWTLDSLISRSANIAASVRRLRQRTHRLHERVERSHASFLQWRHDRGIGDGRNSLNDEPLPNTTTDFPPPGSRTHWLSRLRALKHHLRQSAKRHHASHLQSRRDLGIDEESPSNAATNSSPSATPWRSRPRALQQRLQQQRTERECTTSELWPSLSPAAIRKAAGVHARLQREAERQRLSRLQTSSNSVTGDGRDSLELVFANPWARDAFRQIFGPEYRDKLEDYRSQLRSNHGSNTYDSYHAPDTGFAELSDSGYETDLLEDNLSGITMFGPDDYDSGYESGFLDDDITVVVPNDYDSAAPSPVAPMVYTPTRIQQEDSIPVEETEGSDLWRDFLEGFAMLSSILTLAAMILTMPLESLVWVMWLLYVLWFLWILEVV